MRSLHLSPNHIPHSPITTPIKNLGIGDENTSSRARLSTLLYMYRFCASRIMKGERAITVGRGGEVADRTRCSRASGASKRKHETRPDRPAGKSRGPSRVFICVHCGMSDCLRRRPPIRPPSCCSLPISLPLCCCHRCIHLLFDCSLSSDRKTLQATHRRNNTPSWSSQLR